jgi:hypothetical protein
MNASTSRGDAERQLAAFIRIDSPQVLERPEVQALVAAAIAQARAPLPADGRGQLIIRSVSAKQRPRRKPPQRSGTG